MNDEMRGEKDEQDKRIIRPGCDDFGREIARIAVAQVCQTVGFETFYESALDSLADIAIRYIVELGKSSKFYASVSGRTDCNIFDVAHTLEDFAPSKDTSKLHSHCVVTSGTMLELEKYVETAEEIPFAQPLPRFPGIRYPNRIPSFSQVGEAPKSKHIPAWLPAFPDPHTYIQTPVWNDRVTDPRSDKIELARQHRKAERSLLNLHQRLLSSGLQEETNTPHFENPFTHIPQKEEEEEEVEEKVSPVSIPAEKSETLLQTFSPAIEALRDRLHSEGAPSKRPRVILEFKSNKRLLGEPVDMMIQCVALGKKEPWFGRDGVKDDKKRRVEFMLRQSLENQLEGFH